MLAQVVEATVEFFETKERPMRKDELARCLFRNVPGLGSAASIEAVLDEKRGAPFKAELQKNHIRLIRQETAWSGDRYKVKYLFREGNGLNKKHSITLKEVANLQNFVRENLSLCQLLCNRTNGVRFSPQALAKLQPLCQSLLVGLFAIPMTAELLQII